MQSRTQQEQAEGIPLFITPLIASDFYHQMLIGHIDYTRKGSNKGKNHQMLIGNFDWKSMCVTSEQGEKPQSTIKQNTQSIHTHSNGTTAPSR